MNDAPTCHKSVSSIRSMFVLILSIFLINELRLVDNVITIYDFGYLTNVPFALLVYTINGCSDCTRFKPIFENLPAINPACLLNVDCSITPHLCSDVHKYPTLKINNNGYLSDYPNFNDRDFAPIDEMVAKLSQNCR